MLTCFLDTTACGDLSCPSLSCATQWSSTHQTHTLLLWAARPSLMSTRPATTSRSSTATTSQIHSEITEALVLTQLVEGLCFPHLHCLRCCLRCPVRHRHICSWYWAINGNILQKHTRWSLDRKMYYTVSAVFYTHMNTPNPNIIYYILHYIIS